MGQNVPNNTGGGYTTPTRWTQMGVQDPNVMYKAMTAAEDPTSMAAYFQNMMDNYNKMQQAQGGSPAVTEALNSPSNIFKNQKKQFKSQVPAAPPPAPPAPDLQPPPPASTPPIVPQQQSAYVPAPNPTMDAPVAPAGAQAGEPDWMQQRRNQPDPMGF